MCIKTILKNHKIIGCPEQCWSRRGRTSRKALQLASYGHLTPGLLHSLFTPPTSALQKEQYQLITGTGSDAMLLLTLVQLHLPHVATVCNAPWGQVRTVTPRRASYVLGPDVFPGVHLIMLCCCEKKEKMLGWKEARAPAWRRTPLSHRLDAARTFRDTGSPAGGQHAETTKSPFIQQHHSGAGGFKCIHQFCYHPSLLKEINI